MSTSRRHHSRPAARLALVSWAAAALVGMTALVASCGDDVPSQAEFTSTIGKISGGSVDATLATCVYDKLSKDDPALLKKASQTPDLTKAEDEKLTYLFSRCVVDRHDKSTKAPTTTTGD